MPSERDLTTPQQRVAWVLDAAKAKGLTTEALAERIGCTHATLSQWRTGATDVTKAKASLLKAFCDALGISLDWLLDGPGSEYGTSERLAVLTRKLAAMESADPAGFAMVGRMIDAAAPDDQPPASGH